MSKCMTNHLMSWLYQYELPSSKSVIMSKCQFKSIKTGELLHLNMYMLLLFVGLKAVPANKDVVSRILLPRLVLYTQRIVHVCYENESKIKSCFSELLDNTDDKELQSKLDSLVCNYEKVLKREAKVTSNVVSDLDVVIYTEHLRLWVDVIELFLKNEFVIAKIDFKRKLEEILAYLRKYGWLDDNIDDDVYFEFFVNLHAPTEKVKMHICRLLRILRDGSMYLLNYFVKKRSISSSTNSTHEKMSCGSVSQAKTRGLTNKNQQSMLGDNNNKSSCYTQSTSGSNDIRQHRSKSCTDINSLKQESNHGINDDCVELSVDNLEKECEEYGMKCFSNQMNESSFMYRTNSDSNREPVKIMKNAKTSSYTVYYIPVRDV